MAHKKFHGRRALLNLPGFHSTAAVVAEIEDTVAQDEVTDDDGRFGPRYPFVTLALADCDRSIDFEFDVHSDEGFENSLFKIGTMVDALTELREGMIIERERYKRRREAFEARKAAEQESNGSEEG